MRTFKIALAATLAAAFTSSHAYQPITIDLGFKLNHSLDPEDRSLIAKMPEEIGKSAVATLRQALPMIDKSVHGYLLRVDEIMVSSIGRADCVSASFGEDLAHGVGSKIGFPGKPATEFQKDFEELKTGFSPSATPAEYRARYADFLINSQAFVCRAARHPETKMFAETLRDDAVASARLWRKVEQMKCPNAGACLAMLQGQTESALKAADPRDARRVDAKRQVEAIYRPAKLGWWDDFRQAPYEARMRDLFAVGDALTMAKAIRVESERLCAAANARASEASAALRQASANAESGQADLIRASIALSERSSAEASAALQLFEEARAVDALTWEANTSSVARMAETIKGAADVANGARAKIAEMNRYREEAAQGERFERMAMRPAAR